MAGDTAYKVRGWYTLCLEKKSQTDGGGGPKKPDLGGRDSVRVLCQVAKKKSTPGKRPSGGNEVKKKSSVKTVRTARGGCKRFFNGGGKTMASNYGKRRGWEKKNRGCSFSFSYRQSDLQKNDETRGRKEKDDKALGGGGGRWGTATTQRKSTGGERQETKKVWCGKEARGSPRRGRGGGPPREGIYVRSRAITKQTRKKRPETGS